MQATLFIILNNLHQEGYVFGVVWCGQSVCLALSRIAQIYQTDFH